jgi:hypothetical protein
MSNTRNKTHKKNKRKKEMAFENTKDSFVAGIVVIITILNDAIGLLISIPRTIEWMYSIHHTEIHKVLISPNSGELKFIRLKNSSDFLSDFSY